MGVMLLVYVIYLMYWSYGCGRNECLSGCDEMGQSSNKLGYSVFYHKQRKKYFDLIYAFQFFRFSDIH